MQFLMTIYKLINIDVYSCKMIHKKQIKMMYLYVQMNAALVEEGMDQSPESEDKSIVNLYISCLT